LIAASRAELPHRPVLTHLAGRGLAAPPMRSDPRYLSSVEHRKNAIAVSGDANEGHL